MSEYIETSEYHTAVAKARKQADSAREAIDRFIARHAADGLIDCDANRSIVYSYYNNDLQDISDTSLEDCWKTHDRFRKSLACHLSEAAQRDSLESRILELLKDGCSPPALKEIQKAFRFQNLAQLRAKKDDLESRAAMRAKSPAELRAEIQKAQPNPEQELPEDISRDQIIRLWGPEQIRFWARKCSMAAINRRINSKE
jgi:hypothetical protein